MANGPVRRRVRRGRTDAEYLNTINLRDRVTIHFVWYPGSTILAQSRIKTAVPNHPQTGAERRITFTWRRRGQRTVTRTMTNGSIVISLPSGGEGELRAFGTTWKIHRVGRGVNMRNVNQISGIQDRLNRLGYHLRRPGARNPGVDGQHGRRTELALLQFQTDYWPPVHAPAAAANHLNVRGEWEENTNHSFTNNLNTYNRGACPNPSAADGASLQAAVQANVGG